MALSKDNWAECSIDGCVSKTHGQGLCQKHYMIAYRDVRAQSGYVKPPRLEYKRIDPDDFWAWVKKELKIG